VCIASLEGQYEITVSLNYMPWIWKKREFGRCYGQNPKCRPIYVHRFIASELYKVADEYSRHECDMFEGTFNRFYLKNTKLQSRPKHRSVLTASQRQTFFETRSQNCEKRLIALPSLSVRPSIRPHEKSRLSPDEFSLNLVSEYFWKICRENSSCVKIWQ
jgi:hypothetical protein